MDLAVRAGLKGWKFPYLGDLRFSSNCTDSGVSHRVCQEKQRALKRQKTSKPADVEDRINPPDSTSQKHGVGKGLMTVWRLTNQESNSVNKHGMGKGLMSIQRLTNPGSANLPTCVENDHGACSRLPASTSCKPPAIGKKKSRRQQPVTRRLVNKVQEKTSSGRNKKVRCEQVDKEKQRQRETCEFALMGGRSEEDPSQYAMLEDDEELELREQQETSNPVTRCAYCTANRLHVCSLCKDLLAKFPPNSVRMKQPLHMQPWNSSPQLAKKLFKIFHSEYYPPSRNWAGLAWKLTLHGVLYGSDISPKQVHMRSDAR